MRDTKISRALARRAAQMFGRMGGKKGGSLGGKKRAANMTAEERHASAVAAARVRWAKVRAKKKRRN